MHLPVGASTVRAVFLAALLYFSAGMAQFAHAQNTVHIDATVPAPQPEPVMTSLGANRSPGGEVIGVNSQYLTLNGRPWLPVMGEFHFSRYPEAQWEQEILKMKAAGVRIISTYVIWIHHEQDEGVFDWSGQRDLRRFVQLCRKHGVYVVVRVGPWVHAETRNGGLPDWVVKRSPIRQNDPVYLREVGLFYAQIGRQLEGLLWKDGGPVIGIQIENEYRGAGPGKGAEHIRTLKQMAVSGGLDVPLYTVTGWDGAAIPLDAVLPVFGGYPDAPWDSSPKKLPPAEVYAFRFTNRAAGSMGAIGGGGQNNALSYRGTPFLTAEVGDGIEDTYFRRPVISADDVASIAPVMLGSGVNLLGYYMFHGGRNPDGGAITLQESQRTGYPTDVPVKSYDFQAPLGEFGQERESVRKLKLVHYFLGDFGDVLAPMIPRAPSELPANPSDVSVPRVAARTLGDAGFLFLNNHVRGVSTPSYSNFQVELKLPSGVVKIPDAPVALASGAYGIWPVNFSLGEAMLRYSTAQLFKRVVIAGRRYYFFFAIPGVQPEFALDAHAHIDHVSSNVEVARRPYGQRLRVFQGSEAEVRFHDGVTIVLLSEAHAEQIWQGNDPSLLLSTAADAFADGSRWTLQSTGDPSFRFGLFGAGNKPRVNGEPTPAGGRDSVFTVFHAEVPAIRLQAKVDLMHEAAPRAPWQMGPKISWRPKPIPLAPDDADFAGAAVWKIEIPTIPSMSAVSDVFLRIFYQGDAARLYEQNELIDDNFWNGLPWEIGLRETAAAWPMPRPHLQLHVLPLPRQFPMYLEDADSLRFRDDTAGSLTSVELIPQYQLVVETSPAN